MIFTKAGEAGWKSIIPIYSDYVQWRIAWKKYNLFWLMIALMFVGFFLGYLDGTFVSTSSGATVATGHGGIAGIIGSLMIIAAGVINLVAVYKLFKSFGKSVGWFIGYIFLTNIMLLVLGLGSSEYYGQQD
jgi:hypothetical protein